MVGWGKGRCGAGEAEVIEPDDAAIKTDLTITTAAFGANFALNEGMTLSAGGIYTRAELDAAENANRRLPKVIAAAELRRSAESWHKSHRRRRPRHLRLAERRVAVFNALW